MNCNRYRIERFLTLMFICSFLFIPIHAKTEKASLKINQIEPSRDELTNLGVIHNDNYMLVTLYDSISKKKQVLTIKDKQILINDYKKSDSNINSSQPRFLTYMYKGGSKSYFREYSKLELIRGVTKNDNKKLNPKDDLFYYYLANNLNTYNDWIAIHTHLVESNKDTSEIWLWYELEEFKNEFFKKDNFKSNLVSAIAKSALMQMISIPSLFSVQLVPNPAQNSTCMKGFLESNEEIKISIFDIYGKKVLSLVPEFLKLKQGENSFILDLSSLISGMYFIEIKSDEKTEIARLLVIK